MPREIWSGPLLGNNRQRLIERCARFISEGRPEAFLYITASHPLLEIVTAGLLDGERNRGVWGSLPVHLFRGFVRHLLSTAVHADSGLPLAPRISIDSEELPLKSTLVAEIIGQLASRGKLRGLGLLANSQGLVANMTSLLGELQRSGKTPDEFLEIVESRQSESAQAEVKRDPDTTPRQIDFDRDVATVFKAYAHALDRFGFTEADADQSRALRVLRGEIDGSTVTLPWFKDVELLVLDGFFDFTPIQGEILRILIPAIPNVIVNLNRDERNPEIFRPFKATVEQLQSMAEFRESVSEEIFPVHTDLSALRERLFNPEPIPPKADVIQKPLPLFDAAPVEARPTDAVRILHCSDRETEIRAIGREIKRLILQEGYALSDIAVVVRERTSYAKTIERVFREQSIPCTLSHRINANEIPAVRGLLKLFEIVRDLQTTHDIQVNRLTAVAKSGYLRLSRDEIETLWATFQEKYGVLLTGGTSDPAAKTSALRAKLGLGLWDPDNLENVVAYVGSMLRFSDWRTRASALVGALPVAEQKESILLPPPEDAEDEVSTDEGEVPGFESTDASIVLQAPPGPKPRRDIDPAAIAWHALVLEKVNELVTSLPRKASPETFRSALLSLLEKLQYASEVQRPLLKLPDEEIDRGVRDLRGADAVRRAISAATKSVQIARQVLTHEPESDVDKPAGGAEELELSAFISEVERAIRAQSLEIGQPDPNGVKVLEATDVRGLRFRALFIAGLVEGGFPLRVPRDWIYPPDERERLARFGLTLEDISASTLMKEEHYFYQAACRAIERIYLTRPLVLENGAETVASYYIDELKKAVEPLEPFEPTIRKRYDGENLPDAATGDELAVELIRLEERQIHSTEITSINGRTIEQIIGWSLENGYLNASTLRRIEIERERTGRHFGAYDGIITDPNLISLLAEKFGSDHVFSASGLSLYGKCPYKFFVDRVLKLESKSEAALDLQAIDAGSLLHEVLRRFLGHHRGEQLAPGDSDALKEELRTTADEVFREHQQTIPPLNPNIWKIDCEIRKLMLDRLLDDELAYREKTASLGITARHLELSFGIKLKDEDVGDPASTETFLEYVRDGGSETIRVRGRIDRVDVADNGTAIAYDYKTSTGADLKDMRAGRDLQIGIYLDALERLFLSKGQIVAGGGYYLLKPDRRRNSGLYRKELLPYIAISSNCGSLLPDDEWLEVRRQMERRIWQFVDGMRNGIFSVTPSLGMTTCRTCDFGAVCRYDVYRMKRKQVHAAQPRRMQLTN